MNRHLSLLVLKSVSMFPKSTAHFFFFHFKHRLSTTSLDSSRLKTGAKLWPNVRLHALLPKTAIHNSVVNNICCSMYAVIFFICIYNSSTLLVLYLDSVCSSFLLTCGNCFICDSLMRKALFVSDPDPTFYCF